MTAPDTAAPDGSDTLPFNWLVDCAMASDADSNTVVSTLMIRALNTDEHRLCSLLLSSRQIRVMTHGPHG